MHILVFLLILLAQPIYSQTNACYANCKQGSCLVNSALTCTDCDLGLININGMCVGSSYQSAPLTYLKPNSRNLLSDAGITPINCTIGTLKYMSLSTTIGNTFTRSFNIPYEHAYLQVKFNSIIMALGFYPSNPTLLFNIYSSDGINLHSAVKSFTQQSGGSVQCNNTQIAEDVFYVSQKISSSHTNIIIQVKISGSVNANLALTDIELYFGNCSAQCQKCYGPTESQCLTCRGLLTTLSNNMCLNCPYGFYLNKICLSCPVQCKSCTFTNNQIKCIDCNTNIATSTNGGTVLGCSSTYFKNQTQSNTSFTTSQWLSTETGGSAVSQCGYYSLIGGISIGVSGSTLSYTYTNLPAHTNLYLVFSLFLIDQQLGDTNAYQLNVDGNIQNPTIVISAVAGTQLTNQCGQDSYQMIIKQSFSYNHNSSSAVVQITTLKDYLGVRDIVVLVNNQTSVQNCFAQSNGICTSCRNGLALVNNTCQNCLDGYFMNQQNCQICPITCKSCKIGSSLTIVCISCQPPLVLDSGFCVDANGALFGSEIATNIPTTSLRKWTIYPKLQNRGLDTCNGVDILGSSDNKFKFLSMKRTITGLPPHSGVILFFHFYQIDDYSPDQSVYFVLNSKIIPYTPSNLKMNLCGNSSADAIVPIYLQDNTHSADTLTFQIHMDRSGKIGINNLYLYLINSQNSAATPFKVQSVPTYSISTPPVKGMTVKLIFDSNYINTVDLNSIFLFNLSSTSRLLLENQLVSQVPIANSSANQHKQINYLLLLQKDYSNNQIYTRAQNPTKLYFQDDNGNQRLISQNSISSSLPRYVDINELNVNDRASMRNLYNLFRGCAILAMFIGMGSFLVGFSPAFDDFFILCQLIFVHVFIQLDYNPPSIRIPFQGLHIVQFLQWLPWSARQSIEDGILPNSLYQYSPIVFEQYYKDIVFARTIYQVILYLALLFILWAIIHILLLVWDSKNSKNKYSNYILYFYHSYDAKRLALLDKIVRFGYFTIIWACVLQCTHLSNEPKSFNIWNSVLTIFLFVAVFVYPIVMFFLLRRAANTMSSNTFDKTYQDLRVGSERLYYYLFRYYKLIAIACLIGFLHSSNPMIALILLIIINLADALLLILTKPLGQNQAQLIQATIFYPYYPKIYYFTTIIQQFLFIIMEILFLVLYGQRDSAVSTTFMGIGYAICAFVILLLLNGLFRLFWGFMKIAQHCYLEQQAFAQSVEKQVEQNRDPAEEHPIMQEVYRTQQALSRKQINSRLQSKKMSYVSKLRV